VARTIIFTRLVARPGNLDELLAALDELAVATRAEPGCEMFVVHPARDETDVVLGYEVFVDDDAVAAHRATDAVAHARAQLDELLAEPPIITYALD
jgi:quinol monooxygenase YgiN